MWIGAAFACIASALAVVTFRNPFFSALALIGNLASLAVLYLLLGGEFVAAGQVLVYGGAVMVMFLFVIAYLGDKTDEAPWAGRPVVAGGRDRARRRLDPRRGDRRGRAHDRRARSRHEAPISRSFGTPSRSGGSSSPTT